MMRWLRGVLVVLAIAAITCFIGDWVVFKLRRSPTATVTVSHFVSAQLKNNKQEIDFVGSEEESCSISLFPHEGDRPCWYLRSHHNQTTTY